MDWSPRFACLMPHVLDVPGFNGIRLHPGNTASDTEGCVLLGYVGATNRLCRSQEAFTAFMAVLRPAYARGEAVRIEIH